MVGSSIFSEWFKARVVFAKDCQDGLFYSAKWSNVIKSVVALKDMWKSNPEQLWDKHLQQIIAFAGSGKLQDNSITSNELRDFLAIVPSSQLESYAKNCLAESFPDSGLALQDVVNQIGRRLDYFVTDGQYRGKKGIIGFDGLWTSDDKHSIIVEVKTTDAYRIALNTVADYRKRLASSGQINIEASSILIVVGRQDTGDLEAQIRGSRYAWDIRLISVDALTRLMRLKEEVDNPQIIKQIGEILIPREFTKLDEIIELVFSTAEDVRKEVEEEVIEVASVEASSNTKSSPKFIPVAFHDEVVNQLQKKLSVSLVKRSRAVYLSPEQDKTILCIVSKQHDRNKSVKHFYWYAFHPHQRNLLAASKQALVAFGCGSSEKIVVVPFSDFEPWLEGLNQTIKEDRRYWHVHISESLNGELKLERKKGFNSIDLSRYLV